ncbi:MAG: ribokinase [Clostridiales bacterium]|nr:ribokinase [Clostridiales bacterium]
MKKIVVIGSLNMDFAVNVKHAPKVGETILGDDFRLTPGGKGANQAYAAAKLGGKVTMLGAIGDDTYGQMLMDNLRNAGVCVDYLKKTKDSSTGMALITVDENSDNSIVVIQGANKEVDIPYIDSMLDIIKDCDIVIFQLEIPVETVAYAARRAKEFGKTVILDPAPAQCDLPQELLENADVIKPNENEILTLLGADDSLALDNAVGLLREKGAKNILVTLGADGSCYYGQDGSEIHVPANKVKAVDTTGAGDSYTAAFAVNLSEKKDIKSAMKFASRVGAMAVMKAGAQTSIPTREEVELWAEA